MSIAVIPTTIPVLDLGPFLAGAPGAAARTAAALRDALERVGLVWFMKRNYHGLAADEQERP